MQSTNAISSNLVDKATLFKIDESLFSFDKKCDQQNKTISCADKDRMNSLRNRTQNQQVQNDRLAASK